MLSKMKKEENNGEFFFVFLFFCVLFMFRFGFEVVSERSA